MKQDPDRNAFAQLVESLYQADARKLLLVADRFQKEDLVQQPLQGRIPWVPERASDLWVQGWSRAAERWRHGAPRPSRLHGKE